MPGSFELPVVAKTMALSGKYQAVVCVGAVVRGCYACLILASPVCMLAMFLTCMLTDTRGDYTL